MKYKDLLDSTNKARDNNYNTINIAVISNISFAPFFSPLMTRRFSDYSSVYSNILFIPYEERDLSEHKESLLISDLVIIWLNFELLFSDFLTTEKQLTIDTIALSKKLFNDISHISNARIVWFLFEDYYEQIPVAIGHTLLHDGLVDKININLYNMLNSEISFVNLKHLIAKVGIINAYDQKGKYRWNAPYSKQLIKIAINEIHKQYLNGKGITKKCLVLDCDNVLWGGILSEDGIENIKLGGGGFGRLYQDFQRFLLSLYHHGVILAICSKNDLSDIMTMFREHSEMILKEEHIACFQANWDNKLDNIKRIADTLNIGLDSMTFVDDSPLETEAVKAMLPEVTVILYERDTVYEQFACFNLKSNVSRADIEKRNETYRTNQSREALKSEYESYSDYINALEIKMDIHESTAIEFSRISDLTQRTNKCTTGKRYTVVEIKERVTAKNVELYSLSISDRFSDLGLVGALEIQGDTLTLFSLSCRALGREIEGKLIEFIADRHQIENIEFKSTGKNEDIKIILLKSFPNATLTDATPKS